MSSASRDRGSRPWPARFVGLLGSSGRISGGDIVFDGRSLVGLSSSQWRKVHGAGVSIVFQNPMTSLNPVLSVGSQLAEAISAHGSLGRRAVTSRSVELLALVGLPDPRRQLDSYPHQLSGGMRQRVAIAMAISCEPELLLADEVTTALDVTVQAQIVALIDRLRTQLGMAVVLVSHDLGVVASLADRIVVMSAGKVVEQGPARQVLERPQAVYTRMLLAAAPRLDAEVPTRPLGDADATAPTVVFDRVSVGYASRDVTRIGRRRHIQVVRDVSFTIGRGETVGLVGESGCGKSSLGRALLRLGEAELAGSIRVHETELVGASHADLRPLRREMQMIFQDPFSSMDPRVPVGKALEEPLRIHRIVPPDRIGQRVTELVELVGLRPHHARRLPHELSGGEVQRIAIARALSVEARFLVCDEPTSALDVSIQAQIIALLNDLQDRLGVSYLFISHDLAVVRQLSQRIIVMYLGQFVEWAARDDLFARPLHPYTQALFAAALSPEASQKGDVRPLAAGEPPDPAAPPPGCTFHTRCPFAQEVCATTAPPLEITDHGHAVACHFWRDIESGQAPPARARPARHELRETGPAMSFIVGSRPPHVAGLDATIQVFAGLTTGTLGHLTDFGFAHGLQPLVRPSKAVGRAFTVRLPHLDGVAVHYALNHIERGEVLVIDTSGQRNRAAWGGVTAFAAVEAGVAGVVVDGPVTDWDEITSSGPPVWCNGGTCSLTGRKMGLEGAIQVPVQVGGAVVNPGDIVLADSDGVYFIPVAGSAELAGIMVAREAREPVSKRRLAAGERMADVSGAAGMVEDMMAGQP